MTESLTNDNEQPQQHAQISSAVAATTTSEYEYLKGEDTEVRVFVGGPSHSWCVSTSEAQPPLVVEGLPTTDSTWGTPLPFNSIIGGNGQHITKGASSTLSNYIESIRTWSTGGGNGGGSYGYGGSVGIAKATTSLPLPPPVVVATPVLVSTPPPLVLSMEEDTTDTTTTITDSEGPPEMVRSNDDGESESEGSSSEGGSLSSTEDDDDDETMSDAGFSDIVSEVADTDVDDDDDATSSSVSLKPPTPIQRGVSFNEQVRVLPIPPITSYTPEQRYRMYANRFELRENKSRNKKEYEFDNYDWRNVTEEGNMIVCPLSGELLHPVSCFIICLGGGGSVNPWGSY